MARRKRCLVLVFFCDLDVMIAHCKVKSSEELGITTNRIDGFIYAGKRITIFNCSLIKFSVIDQKRMEPSFLRTSTGGEENSLVDGSTIPASSIFLHFFVSFFLKVNRKSSGRLLEWPRTFYEIDVMLDKISPSRRVVNVSKQMLIVVKK